MNPDHDASVSDASPKAGAAADNPLRERAVVGGLWALAQNGYTVLASAVAFVVLARLISPRAFGLAALAQVFVALTTLLADVGVTPAMIAADELTDETLSTGFWLGLGMAVMFGGLLELVAAPIGAALHQHQLVAILRVVALAIPLTALTNVPTVILSRELKMRAQAVRQALSVTVGAIGALIMAFAGFGVWALVFQDFGTAALDAFVLWRIIDWRPRMHFQRSEARGLLRFGVQVAATQLVNQGRDRVAQLLIGGLLGTRALGFWSIAVQMSQIAVSVISQAINAVALPAFAMVAGDRLRLQRALGHAVRISATVALPSLAALAAMSPILIPFLFGARWHTSGDVVQINAIAYGVTAFQWVDSNVWWALAKPRVELLLVFGIALVELSLVWFCAPYGLVAIALGQLARTFVSVPLRLTAIVKLAHMPLDCYSPLPAIALCSAGMWLSVRGVGASLEGHLPTVVVLAAEGLTAACAYLALALMFQRSTLREFRADFVQIKGRRNDR